MLLHLFLGVKKINQSNTSIPSTFKCSSLEAGVISNAVVSGVTLESFNLFPPQMTSHMANYNKATYLLSLAGPWPGARLLAAALSHMIAWGTAGCVLRPASVRQLAACGRAPSCTCLLPSRVGEIPGGGGREAAGDGGRRSGQGRSPSCLRTGGSFCHLSLSGASRRACPRTPASFNKHQIPEQVLLRTCEAWERAVCVQGRRKSLRKYALS